MRQRHVPDTSTIEALLQRKNGTVLRALATELGYAENQAATLGAVCRGKSGIITAEGENELRLRLGLEPIQSISIAPCPSCGGAHVAGDCHGETVAAVVILRQEGAQIVYRNPPTRWRDLPVKVLRDAIMNREVYRP